MILPFSIDLTATVLFLIILVWHLPFGYNIIFADFCVIKVNTYLSYRMLCKAILVVYLPSLSLLYDFSFRAVFEGSWSFKNLRLINVNFVYSVHIIFLPRQSYRFSIMTFNWLSISISTDKDYTEIRISIFLPKASSYLDFIISYTWWCFPFLRSLLFFAKLWHLKDLAQSYRKMIKALITDTVIFGYYTSIVYLKLMIWIN